MTRNTLFIFLLIGFSLFGNDCFSKSIDGTPDLTSDEFWEQFDVLVVEVLWKGEDRQGIVQLKLKSIEPLTPGAKLNSEFVPLHSIWCTDQGFRQQYEPPPVKEGDRFVFYQPQVRGVPAGTMIKDPQNEPEELKTVRKIVQLCFPKEIEQSVFDSNPKVAAYALGRLLKNPRVYDPKGFSEKIDKLRDDPTADMKVRILASQLLNRLPKRAGEKDDDWDWIVKTISNLDDKASQESITAILLRLVAFPEKRPQKADILINQFLSKTKQLELRLGIISIIDDPKIFNYANPSEPISKRIIETMHKSLSDETPEIRYRSANVLTRLAQSITPVKERKELAEKTLTWMRQQLKNEVDDVVKQQLNVYIQGLENDINNSKENENKQ